MPAATITWMVLARDVPPTVRVRGADRLAAAMVLDADTGLVRGIAIEQTTGKALQQAVTAALTQPAAELPSGAPDRVLCATGLAAPVRTALTAAGSADRSAIVEVQPGPDAEDIFDSILGHMAGRAQPEEFPTPADWQVLIEQAAELRQAEPWTRWSDEQDLVVELQLPGGASPYIAVVMGQAGVQHGLVLYPGDQLPAGLREPGPAEQAPTPPAGTLLVTLDPPEAVPVELTAKAIRYGWPPEDNLVPAFIAFTATGPAEIGRDDAQRLTAGIAAVLAVDRRGPTLADVAGKPITGSILVGGQQPIEFAARHRPRHDEPPQPALRLHLAGHDLLPPDTPVTLGHLTWQALPELRVAARVHRPAPLDAPSPAGRELPLLVLSPEPRQGPSLAAKIANRDPYGVSAVDTGDGQRLLVLAGGEAAEILISLPANHPALTAFHRRLRQTKGRHVIMVTDPASATGDGSVYGLFECHQPPLPPLRGSRRTSRLGDPNAEHWAPDSQPIKRVATSRPRHSAAPPPAHPIKYLQWPPEMRLVSYHTAPRPLESINSADKRACNITPLQRLTRHGPQARNIRRSGCDSRRAFRTDFGLSMSNEHAVRRISMHCRNARHSARPRAQGRASYPATQATLVVSGRSRGYGYLAS